MAITQQIGRVEPSVLDRCRRDDEFLHSVLDGSEVLKKSDVLDLDWSPSPLKRLFELAGVDGTALRRALDGDEIVNPEYQNYITVYAPVTMLTPPAVVEASSVLQSPDLAHVSWDSLAMTDSEARAALDLTDYSGSAREYVDGHLTALRTFYAGAAARGAATIQWWD